MESETVEKLLSGRDVLNWPEFEALMNRLGFPMSDHVTSVGIYVGVGELVEVAVSEFAVENAVS